MAQFSYELRIPKERIAVLIGTHGEVKKKIEQETRTLLKIDSGEGDIIVMGEDALSLYTTREIITAIGRGFNPDIALLLLKQDYAFELINITDYVKTKNHEARLKGRVIGESGKCRKTIEALTGCYISVYGKTIGMVGGPENLSLARRAIDTLLRGSPHSNVYRWLEKQRRQFKNSEF